MTMLGALEKRLLLAILIVLWLVVQLVLALRYWGEALPNPPELPSFSAAANRLHRVNQLREPFTLSSFTQLAPALEMNNPFFPNPTQPPPPPPPAPPAPPKVDLLYQGMYETSLGQKYAYLQVGTNLLVGTNGSSLLTNFTLAEINLRNVLVRDAAGKKYMLEFNVKKSFELPSP